MNTYIGIDLGTSGIKLLLVDREGGILAENNQDCEILYPRQGWTEQEPEKWWNAVIRGINCLLYGQDKASVKGISFGGQMHGLVALDRCGNVIRPCILWNDSRTESHTKYLNCEIGTDFLSSQTGNIAFAGFTAPKILWMRENEPENYRRIWKIMLPKDFLAYRFSGVVATDMTDASGTLLLDVKHRSWSRKMCDICGISSEMLPELLESFDVVGNIIPELADKLELSRDVKIIIGAGDNAAAAVGSGVVTDGSCSISLGTSGTVFLAADRFSMDSRNALHSFCHANGQWHLMGCILSAASCRKWWLEDIIGTCDYAADEVLVSKSDADGLFFLPYLSGERSPHNDVNARGAFIGLSSVTSRAQMSRAVMEGVAFAIRDCLEASRENGVTPASATLCGGGAKSSAWRQIMADVLGIPMQIPVTEQGPAYGAAMLAMVGCGEYSDVKTAVRNILCLTETYMPNAEANKAYNEKYTVFRKLYPALRDCRV